jgi:hypothetical protein
MNKVLNRPMFRRVALKKGHLKPLKRNTGGGVLALPNPMPMQGPAKPTFTQNLGARMSRFGQKPAVRFGKELFSIPVQLGFQAGGKMADAFGIPKGFNVGRLGLEALGSYGAARALPGLAVSSIGVVPSLVGLGTLGVLANRTKAGMELRKKINQMTPAERAEFERMNRLKATDYMSEGVSDADLFGKFVPKAPEPVKPKVSAVEPGKPAPGQGRVGIDRAKLKQEGDTLLSDQFEGPEGDANLDKIQSASMPGGVAPVPPGTTDTEETVVAKKEEPMTTGEKQQDEAATTAAQTGVSVPGDASFDQTIRLAKKYYDEMDEGTGSQAGLLFLANLASGLLTGTTRKGGIGGAMEVLGQALGPAVNNYVTVKLKEGELRSNRREASLNAALDHMKFLNEGAKMERPEIDSRGVIQFRGADGKLRNYRGFMGKDGTAYMPGGLGPDGREILIPIQQQGMIQDSMGNDIGTFQNFQAQKDIGKRLFEIQDILGNRYNALSVTRDVLQTLGQMDESGEKVKAGAALSVDTFIRRFSGVAKELVGLDVLDNDITNLTLGQLEDKVLKLQEDEYRKIEESDLSDAAKKEAKELLSKDNLIEQAKAKLKKRGLLSGLSREEQEKLAVQETTLVYALANTFKDQDRLTQRDIDAARNIVNIFSLSRSSADVRASIQAISKQLEGDIRRQEELFRQAGGLEKTLQDLRRLAKFETFGTGTVQQQLAEDLSLEEIEQGLEDVNL